MNHGNVRMSPVGSETFVSWCHPVRAVPPRPPGVMPVNMFTREGVEIRRLLLAVVFERTSGNNLYIRRMKDEYEANR